MISHDFQCIICNKLCFLFQSFSKWSSGHMNQCLLRDDNASRVVSVDKKRRVGNVTVDVSLNGYRQNAVGAHTNQDRIPGQNPNAPHTTGSSSNPVSAMEAPSNYHFIWYLQDVLLVQFSLYDLHNYLDYATAQQTRDVEPMLAHCLRHWPNIKQT